MLFGEKKNLKCLNILQISEQIDFSTDFWLFVFKAAKIWKILDPIVYWPFV